MDGSARAVRIIAAIFFVAMLYFARDVLIPSALAVMLAFLLHPLVLRLGRFHINRGIAVGITVILAGGVAGGVGYLVGRQFVDFSQEVPRYEGNLRLKARSFRSHGGTLVLEQHLPGFETGDGFNPANDRDDNCRRDGGFCASRNESATCRVGADES